MKKWSSLVLAAIVAMGTFAATGCIENLEPAGIEELRGAKAELLRAEAAYKQAQIALVEADAAYTQAQAKVEEAKVAKIEAEAAVAEAEAAYYVAQAKVQAAEEAYWLAVAEAEAAKGEADAAYRLAEAEKVLAEAMQAEAAAIVAMAEAEAEVAAIAADLEVYLLEVQTAMVEAQMAYEVAVKNLYAAQVSLTPAQKDYLAPFEAEVEGLEGIIFNVMEALEYAADDLEAAIAELDEAVADSLGRIQAERYVADCEIALEEAKEALAEALEFAALDPQILDWQAEMEKYEAERDALAVAVAQTYKAVNDFNSAPEAAEMNEAMAEFEAYTGREFVGSSNTFKPYATLAQTKLITWENEVYVPAILDEEGEVIYGDYHRYDLSVPYGEKFEEIADEVEHIQDYMIVDEETVAEYVDQINADIKDSEDYHLSEDAWKAAVEAYKSGEYIDFLETYPLAYVAQNYFYNYGVEYSIEELINDYNTALATKAEAIKELEKYNYTYTDAGGLVSTVNMSEIYMKYYAEASAKETQYIVEFAKEKQALVDARNAIQLQAEKDMTPYYNVLSSAFGWGPSILDEYDAAMADYADETLSLEERTAAKAAADSLKALPNFATMDHATGGSRLTQEEYEDDEIVGAFIEAETAFAKADADYNKAYNEAFMAHSMKVQAAYDEAVATINEIMLELQYSEIDSDYLDILLEQINGFYYCESQLSYEVLVHLDLEEEGLLYDKVWNSEIQDYEYIYKEVKSLYADKELFYDSMVTIAAAEFFGEDFASYLYLDDADLTVLPTVEQYIAYLEDREENGVFGFPYEFNTVSEVLDYERYEKTLLEITEYTEEFEAYIAALQAVEKEFLAYVAEEEARIDAIEAEVEAFFAARAEEGKALNEAYEDARAAQSANAVATYAIMDALDTYVQYVTGYYGYTIEDYVEAIEGAVLYCEGLVESAEEDLYYAKKDLEAINADEIDAVEVAQKKYDYVKETLDFLMEAYDEAVLALENAIAEVTGQAEVTE